MGFFYKAGGGGGGVTVVEGASFDALATSAKSQDHGVLMLDTSTGFYYKNWKTDGPGIPIPVEYFDDTGGYVGDSAASEFNYFYGPDTLSGASGTMFDRGFTTIRTTGTGVTSSKVASGPLILTGPTSGSGENWVIFKAVDFKYHSFTIVKITKAVQPTSGNARTGIYYNHPRSATQRSFYFFNPTHDLGKIEIQDSSASVATIETFGDQTSTQPITVGGVINQRAIIEVNTTTAKSTLKVRWLTDRELAGTTTDKGILNTSAVNTFTGVRCPLIGSEVQIFELHTLYFN